MSSILNPELNEAERLSLVGALDAFPDRYRRCYYNGDFDFVRDHAGFWGVVWRWGAEPK